MFVIAVTFLALICEIAGYGLHLEEPRFNSWYLSDFCDEATNVTGDIQLSVEGPSSGGVFALAYKSPYYKPGLNCTVHLVAPASYKILLSFSQVQTRSRPLDNVTLEVAGVEKLVNESVVDCPKEDCSKYQYTGKRIQLNFSSSPTGTVEPKLVGFNSVVTAFVEADATTMCPRSEHFRCQNLRCIWRGLYCNGQNNCGDGSDEPSHCPTTNTWGILVIIFGAVCFCIFVPLFCFLILWGSRKSINTTTSKYHPILDGSVNDIEADHMLESDFLFGSVMQGQYGTIRPHSYTFTYGSNTPPVQISPTTAPNDGTVSKSLGEINSALPV